MLEEVNSYSHNHFLHAVSLNKLKQEKTLHTAAHVKQKKQKKLLRVRVCVQWRPGKGKDRGWNVDII